MSTSARTLRRVSILFVAIASAACGLFLVFRFVTVDQIGSVSTAHLLGLLGLFVLPVFTLGALELDRRAKANAPRRRDAAVPAPNGRVAEHAPAELTHPPGVRDPRQAGRARGHTRHPLRAG